MSTEIAALRQEVRALRKSLAEATREAQARDFEDLASRMKVGEIVTIPEGEVLGGYTLQKMANGKLRPLDSVGGIPVIHNTSNRRAGGLDFSKELEVSKARSAKKES